jgi:MoaA/NifB/PqqE/SkfB family radical SAM enzyme
MCNIWKTRPDSPELSAGSWLRLLSSPVLRNLRELDITGGEPFLRDDLPDLLKGIVDLKGTRLRQLRSVAITSNGFLTDRISSVMSQAVPMLKEANLELVMVFAMDGIGAIHDEIRQVRKGWQKLDSSIAALKQIRETHSNVVIGLKTTVLPINVTELEGIVSYAEENGLFTIISPCIITENRYDNADLKKNLRFGVEDIEKMRAFYESSRFMWGYHRDMLLHFLHKGTVVKPCSAGFNYFFVKSNGDVYPCPLIVCNLGNVEETSVDELMGGSKAREFRRKIGARRECKTCTEPGLERYALPFEGFHYLNLLRKLSTKEFLDLHEHMGLGKYV